MFNFSDNPFSSGSGSSSFNFGSDFGSTFDLGSAVQTKEDNSSSFFGNIFDGIGESLGISGGSKESKLKGFGNFAGNALKGLIGGKKAISGRPVQVPAVFRSVSKPQVITPYAPNAASQNFAQKNDPRGTGRTTVISGSSPSPFNPKYLIFGLVAIVVLKIIKK